MEWVTSWSLFIGGSLLLLAAIFPLAGRRRAANLVLAVFLALVATNFLAGAAARLASDVRWSQVATVALALDPFYLVLFTTLHPFPRRSRRVLAGLALLGLGSLVGVVAAILLPQDPVGNLLWRLWPNVVMALGYTAAWVLAVHAAAQSPTRMLGQRAAWVAGAIGVAVVPRLGLLTSDFKAGQTAFPASTVGQLAVDIGLGIVIMAGLFGWARVTIRHSGGETESAFRGPLRLVAVVVGLVVALRFALEAPTLLGLPNPYRLGIPYGIRWLAFGAILLYGILAYEVVEFRGSAERLLRTVGTVLGALTGLLVAALAFDGLPGIIAFPATAGSLLLGVVAGGVLTRRAVARVAPPTMDRPADRRLELYQAALESAWARGPPAPEARRLLERDRRAFGVSFDEARALEHVVAGQAVAPSSRLAIGDEATAGVVLESVLGEGTHGRVFLARQYPSGRRVVVKELRAETAGSEAARRRMMQELRALQSIEHPNVARLLDVDARPGRYLLLMQHVEGRPLSEMLAAGRAGPAGACRIGTDLLDALETVHRLGVVHRDIKPSNIILGTDGRARLTDFGVAVLRQEEPDLRTTATSMRDLAGFAGTLAYAAPEQLDGKATPASDLYAVGLVLYELLAGRPAIDLRGARIVHALERIARPQFDLDAVPGAWRPFLERCLQREPDARFPSALSMRRALLELAPCRFPEREGRELTAGTSARSDPR